MNLQRITRIQVAIVWLVLAVGLAALFLLMFIQPQQKRIKQTIEAAEASEAVARQKGSTQRALEEAQKQETLVNSRYEKILNERMPKLDFSDPIASTIRMWDLGSEEQQLMDRWFASTGARVTGYSFPSWGANMPGSFPNATQQMLTPLNWTLTVETKDFSSFMDWLLKLPEAPRFMVMGNPIIQGPRNPGQPLIAQVPVTLYQWTGVLPGSGGGGGAAAQGAAEGQLGGGGMGGRMGGGRMGGGRGM